MSRLEVNSTVCDLDGVAAAAPVRFAIGGHAYETDLCPPHKDLMYRQLRPYLTAARPARAPAPQAKRRAADRRVTAAMRAWAKEHAAEYGWEIGERGRMPAGVAAAYRAAMGGAR